MKIILTGATGFVGEGILLECLKDERVEKVLSISRKPCGHKHEKLEELITKDLLKLPEGDERLQGYDAMLYCAGQYPNVWIWQVIQTFPISKPFSFCTVNQQHNTQKVWILFVIFVVDNVSFNFKATNYDKGNK